jgi:exopolyphosphatase/guanosine-5'-triphosphate,3'-diphosphate pyrophosphatase
MRQSRRIGIIDIGSNSVRLVIYEETAVSAYRVIEESKDSARLSERVSEDGRLSDKEIGYLAQTLKHFKQLCDANRTTEIRAVATAAVRNAKNSERIVKELQRLSGLTVEILPGLEEARLGFLGMANAMDVKDGFLIDIGGGSTEISLFRSRQLVHSVSFPFGSVNTTKRYTEDGEMDEQAIRRVRQMVESAIGREPWIKHEKGLPLIGLGGTIRSLCRLDQRLRKYSLSLTHNYTMSESSVDQLVNRVCGLSVENRKKIEGMSKERADIIAPGLVILQTIFKLMGASHYIVSGTGLRDGLFYETVYPQKPIIRDVLEQRAQLACAAPFRSAAPRRTGQPPGPASVRRPAARP